MTSCSRAALAIACCTFAAPAGAAVDGPQLLDDVAVRIGGLLTRFDTTIHSAATEDRSAETIDFDRELGLKDHKLIESVAISWRVAVRHEFGIDYFNEELSGVRKLGRDIVFQDETFPLATTVQSRFTLETFEFHYTYWPLATQHWAAGMRIGFVDYRLNTRMTMLLGEQGEPPDVRVEASFGYDVPAPTIGLDLRFVPTRRWRFGANFGWFEAKFENVSPVIATARAGAEFFITPDFGLWLDYSLSHLDADIHSSSFQGAIDIYEGGTRLGVIWRM